MLIIQSPLYDGMMFNTVKIPLAGVPSSSVVRGAYGSCRELMSSIMLTKKQGNNDKYWKLGISLLQNTHFQSNDYEPSYNFYYYQLICDLSMGQNPGQILTL